MNKYNITAIVRDKRGRILSIGKNSYTRTHPLMQKAMIATKVKNYSYLHAEVAALVKLKDWTKANSIEVFRYTKNGMPAIAKPCACCQWVIKQAGIKPENVFHT